MENIKKIEISKNTLERNSSWISNCDNRSGVLLVFQTGLVTFFFSEFDNIKKIIQNQTFGFFHFILYFSSVLLCFFSIRSIFYAFRSLFPDIKTRDRSLLFFGSIISMSKNQYYKELKNINSQDILKDISSQVYITSQIVNKKMSYLQKSIKDTLFSFVFLLVIIFCVTLLS